PQGVHYAGIGVGKHWGRMLMRASAAWTGGNYTQINPDEAIAWRTMAFVTSLRLPRWQDLKVADESGRSWLLTDASIGAGEELCATIRFAKTEPMPKLAVIRGVLSGKEFVKEVAIEPLLDDELNWWQRLFKFGGPNPASKNVVHADVTVNRVAGY